MLLRNTPVTRQLMRDGLSFVPQNTTFTDQSALVELIQTRNQTYRECVVKVLDPRQLQSRVRGPVRQLDRRRHGGSGKEKDTDGRDWILHLPNHNRWELLTSLTTWLLA